MLLGAFCKLSLQPDMFPQDIEQTLFNGNFQKHRLLFFIIGIFLLSFCISHLFIKIGYPVAHLMYIQILTLLGLQNTPSSP